MADTPGNLDPNMEVEILDFEPSNNPQESGTVKVSVGGEIMRIAMGHGHIWIAKGDSGPGVNYKASSPGIQNMLGNYGDKWGQMNEGTQVMSLAIKAAKNYFANKDELTSEMQEGLDYGKNVSEGQVSGTAGESVAGMTPQEIWDKLPDVVTINGKKYNKDGSLVKRWLFNPLGAADEKNAQILKKMITAQETDRPDLEYDIDEGITGEAEPGEAGPVTPLIDAEDEIVPIGDDGVADDGAVVDENLRQEFIDGLDKALADGIINQDVYDLFVTTYDTWDPGQTIDVNSVLEKFNEIKETTIDPYFSEQISIFTRDLEDSLAFQQQQREQELEAERTLAGQNIRQAKAGLEKAGMTFTGKAIEELGAESAFPQAGAVPGAEGQVPAGYEYKTNAATGETQLVSKETGLPYTGVTGLTAGAVPTTGVAPTTGAAAIPSQTPFGGMFYEGTVNQMSRLMSSSSLAKYQQNLQELGKAAEKTLGTEAALGYNIPGYGAIGDVQGTVPYQQQQAYADLLSQLAGQGQQNWGYGQNLDYGL